MNHTSKRNIDPLIMDFLTDILNFFPDSPLKIYIAVFLGPFVQEDAAVLLAASLSANNPDYHPTMFFVILAGLFLSDAWKYWIGWAALKNERARAFTEKKHVADFQDKVQANIVATLFAARFVPLTRIPAYVACGFFRVPYWKYCILIAITAMLYTVIIFASCHLVGEVIGERFEWLMPIGGVILALSYVGYKVWRSKRAA